MGRDTLQLETTVNTIFHEYLLEFTSEYGIPKMLHPELPGPKDRIVDFLEGKVGVYTRVDVIQQKAWEEHSLMLHQATGLSQKLEQPLLLSRLVDKCLQRRDVGWEHVLHRGRSDARYTSYGPIQFDLFPKSYEGEDWEPPTRPHEVPLLTLTVARVIEMDAPAATIDSSGVSSTIERSPLDFAHEAGASDQGTVAPEMPPYEDVPATEAPVVGVSDPDPLSLADPLSRHPADVSQSSQGIAAVGDPESKNASSPIKIGSPESIYRPEWGVANGSLLDTPEAYQDLAIQCQLSPAGGNGVTTALKIRTGSKAAKEICSPGGSSGQKDSGARARDKKLKALLEAETNTKKAVEDKSAGLSQELKNMRARFSDLQVSNEHVSQQVATLQQQVAGKEKLKAAFEEFKWQQDDWVEQRCAEMEARLDALSIDFDKEIYPHMLTAIAGRRWVIGRGLRLTMMKYDESLELRQAFVDPVSARIAKGLSEGLRHRLEHALKNLKYPLVDQLEGLKDASIDVIMAALYLESDTGDDAPQYICDLRPSSSQLSIPVYLEERDPQNPWACKEEMVLADAIAANISRAEKKKKCRIVCRTDGVGFAHHAKSDGVPVSVPTVVPQGLSLFLADAATQTEFNT
nr:hypothetical protein [Tanacetum cinerariifolium]